MVSTLVQASGCSFKCVNTSCAILCCNTNMNDTLDLTFSLYLTTVIVDVSLATAIVTMCHS